MFSRVELTNRLVNILPTEHSTTLDNALSRWWINLRINGGFRLTKHGYQILLDVLELESWNIPTGLTGDLGFRAQLDMDRKISGPYYTDIKGSIILFSAKDAMIYGLYRDFTKWLAVLPRQPQL
jgi:hypothetical protein